MSIIPQLSDLSWPCFPRNYEEAERVEGERESIEDYPEWPGENIVGRKALLFTKPREEQSPDFKGMAKMMQKLSNRIIDMEKEKEAQKFYKPYYKKGKITINPNPLHTALHL